MPPFFSVITATYNAAATLPRLLDSLIIQTCRDFELILQDGMSQDKTLSVLELYRDQLPALSVASEPDNGVYSAWNMALPRARGEWVLFLGADDSLADDDTLATVFPLLQKASATIIFGCGDVLWTDGDNRSHKHQTCRAEGTRALLPLTIPVCHSSLWHRNTLFKDLRFNPSFRIASDYDLLCRAWKDDSQGLSLGVIVTRMQRGGISDRPINCFRHRWEYARIAMQYFTGTWTAQRILSLIKGAAVTCLAFLMGAKRTPRLLNRIRKIRRLPPTWLEP